MKTQTILVLGALGAAAYAFGRKKAAKTTPSSIPGGTVVLGDPVIMYCGEWDTSQWGDVIDRLNALIDGLPLSASKRTVNMQAFGATKAVLNYYCEGIHLPETEDDIASTRRIWGDLISAKWDRLYEAALQRLWSRTTGT